MPVGLWCGSSPPSPAPEPTCEVASGGDSHMMAAQLRVPAPESDPVGRGGVRNGAEPSGSTVGMGCRWWVCLGSQRNLQLYHLGTSWLCLGVWGPSWSLGLVAHSPLHPTLSIQAVYLVGGRLRVLLHV